MVRTWTGQVARAAGASLLAPLILLLAAGALASGGGMGGFASLGEISSGPSLPDTGLAATPRAALGDAEVPAVDLASPADGAAPPASPGGAIASADSPASSLPPTGGRSLEGSGQRLFGRTQRPETPATPGAGQVTAPTNPAQPPASPPGPAGDLGQVTSDLGEAVRAPLEPLTNAILELLRGPPRR